jgi:two-component system, OmpR family, aerobic respiration control sensor histidine kinase ArcB
MPSNKKIAQISLQEIIDQLPAHVYWKDRDGVRHGCSEATWKSFGRTSLDDYIGKNDYDLFPKEQADKLAQVDREVIRTGKDVVVEELSDLHDKTTGLFLSHKAPLRDTKGDIVGLIGVSLDVTRARAEDKKRLHVLESIIALMPGHVYWKDKKGKYLGCNNTQAASLGLRANADILEKEPYENLSEEEANLLRKGDARVLSDGKTITLEEPGIREDGTTGAFLTKKTPLYNQDGATMGLLGISFDITERKEAERLCAVAKENAEKSNKIKTDFISNMEHDIRTPLVGVHGMIDILAQQETDSEKKALLHDVSLCSKELMNYCDKILEFSRIEAEAKPIMSSLFPLRKAVESVITIESVAARHKNIDLSLYYDEKLPTVVMGDAYRLKRILLNLVSNAIKFTQEGFAKVSVSLEKVNQDSRTAIVKFVVEDSGMGIPDDKKVLIYERFTKVMPSNTGLYKGLGLGLRIVKQFVDELDGDIHLKSELKRGSTFVIFLPFKIPLSDNVFD